MLSADTSRRAPAVSASAALPGGDWRGGYTRRLLITDTLAVVWAVSGTQLIWFGLPLHTNETPLRVAIAYLLVSFVIGGLWLAVLRLTGSRDDRVVGAGTTEYRRVLSSSLGLFGALSAAAYLFDVDITRGYLLTALPLGLLMLLLSRATWRRWLSTQRSEGAYSFRVLLVGSADSVSHYATELGIHSAAGYRVVGAVIPGAKLDRVPGTAIRAWSSIDDVLPAMDDTGADTVAVTGTDALPPSKLRQLSWSLEPGRRHLMVAPNLTDIAGPRIHTRPVAGLPLIHVETPRFDGSKVGSKRAFDLVGSGLLVLALSPLFIGIALLVKLTSTGPVFYRQQRIGANGEPFGMLKFRSMKVDADKELAALLAQQGTSDTPLFKVTNDPRITPVGRVLRKYSLDELPQLLNVVLGDMSLVGPRPQIADEVALYDSAARRRLLLKPGMSGLWQVSGRSSLSWADAIRLDLYYVENWSLTGDIVILWRTIRAVVMPGADAH